MSELFNYVRYYIKDDSFELFHTNLEWIDIRDRLTNPDTASDTATTVESIVYTNMHGPWWDCWVRVSDMHKISTRMRDGSGKKSS